MQKRWFVAPVAAVIGATGWLAFDLSRAAPAESTGSTRAAPIDEAPRVANPTSARRASPTSPPAIPDEPEHRQQALAEADRVLESIRSSGASSEAMSAAAAVFARYVSDKPAAIDVVFSEPRCYRDGCIVTADYRDMVAVQAVNDVLPTSEAFRAWDGPKFRSLPIEQPDGRLRAEWALLRQQD